MMPFGKIDPKKMQGMLKQMGMKSKDIEAEEVIIKQGNKRIVIREPQISEVEFSGQKSFQISGIISEEGPEDVELKDKDIMFVAETAHVDRIKATEALTNTKGDIAKAILILRNPQK